MNDKMKFKLLAHQLETMNCAVRLPNFLERGQTQFTEIEANESRLVTKNRWVVEARHGVLKNKFKILRRFDMVNAPNIISYYKICAALLNKFFKR